MKVSQMAGCIGCPLRGTGEQLFTPDVVKDGSPVQVVYSSPPDNPALAATRLATRLKGVGLEHEGVSVQHGIRCSAQLPAWATSHQIRRGEKGPAEEAVLHCHTHHGRLGASTRLLVTIGDAALYSSTGERSSLDWRGWVLPYRGTGNGWKSRVWTPGPRDLPVLAMATAAFPWMGYVTAKDWSKVPRILAGEWPQKFPGFTTEPPKVWPKVSAFDTEFSPETGILTRYSLYDGGARPWVVEAGDIQITEVPDGSTVIMHNIEADLDHLQRFLRGGRIKTEDTMLMHSVLWSDLPHDLEFLGSLSARINRWKHLGFNDLEYSAGDAIGTWDAYLAMVKEYQADPQSMAVYRNCVFPLTPIIMEATTTGLLLDQDKVQQALRYHEQERTDVALRAQAYTGYPINMGSSEQLSRWLYSVEGLGKRTKAARKKR